MLFIPKQRKENTYCTPPPTKGSSIWMVAIWLHVHVLLLVYTSSLWTGFLLGRHWVIWRFKTDFKTYLSIQFDGSGETEFMNSWTFMNHSWTVHEQFMNWEEKFLKKFMNFWFMNSSWNIGSWTQKSSWSQYGSKLPSMQSGNMASILLAKIYPSW